MIMGPKRMLYLVFWMVVFTRVAFCQRQKINNKRSSNNNSDDEQLPGFRMRITRQGMNFGKKLGLDIFMHELSRLKIPDSESSIGLTEVRLSNITMLDFPRPRVAIIPMPRRGIHMLVTEVAATLAAKYDANFGMGFFTIEKNGTVIVNATDVSISLKLRIGTGTEGRPMLLGVGCRGSGNVEATFTGGWSDLLNIGSTVFNGMVRRIMVAQICANTKKEMVHQIRKELLTLPVKESVAKYFDLDYSLTRFPTFQRRFIEMHHKGVIHMKGRTVPLPFSPPVIPAYQNNNKKKMMYIYVTDYVLNSGFYAAFINDKLRVDITETMFPTEVRGFLTTNCLRSTCLGTIFPKLRIRYPDATAKVAIAATRNPEIRISGPQVTLNAWGEANIRITSGDNIDKLVFTADYEVQGSFSVRVVGTKIVFNVTELTPVINVTGFAITDEYMRSQIDNTLKTTIRSVLFPKLAELGLEGITLPHVNDIHFINSEILQEPTDHIMIVGTDVAFNPYPDDDSTLAAIQRDRTVQLHD